MRLAIIGAVIGATVLGALPASAEVVIRADDRGVSMHDRDRDRDRDGYRHHDDWRRHHAECRMVRERIVTRSGRVIFRMNRIC